MTQNEAPNGVTTRALNRSAVTYDRREALVALLAVPIALAAGASMATETVDYPVWTIETGGGGRVYLFGHTPPRPLDWSDSRIEGLLRTCSSLWDETNQTERTDAQGLMKRYGIDPNKPLNTWLSPSDQDRLSQAAKIAGVPEDALQPFRPWLAGQALEGAFFSAKGVNGRNADAVLVSEASEAGLSVSSEFATKEDAARWLADFSPVQEVQYLRYILDEILAGHDEGQRIYADWAIGKDVRAADWVANMKQLYPELYHSLLIRRNQGWVPRVRSMLAQPKPTMIVVGLYHLVGPDSIQAQLRANGLHVKRI
jgi:uncharacterized protein YbaP (TraB family)